MYAIMAWLFPIWYFLECYSKRFKGHVHHRAFFEPLKFFFHVIYPFGLSIMFYLFPCFTLEVFCFVCVCLLVYLLAFSTNLLAEFSLVTSECPVVFLLLDPVSVSFESPFFRQYLMIYLLKFYFQTWLLLFFIIPTYLCGIFPPFHFYVL